MIVCTVVCGTVKTEIELFKYCHFVSLEFSATHLWSFCQPCKDLPRYDVKEKVLKKGREKSVKPMILFAAFIFKKNIFKWLFKMFSFFNMKIMEQYSASH